MKDFEDLELDTIWDLYLTLNICSEETLQVVTSINGYNLATMKDILYATTGLRSIEQVIDEWGLTPDSDPELFDDDYVEEDEDEDEDEEKSDLEEELKALSKKDLRAIAKDFEVEVAKDDSKEDIIEALLEEVEEEDLEEALEDLE